MIKLLIKKIIPTPLQPMLKKEYHFFKYDVYSYIKNRRIYKKRIGSRNIYLIGTPEHDNLGDHAIAMATLEFLQQNSASFDIHEISLDMYLSHQRCLLKYIKRDDIVLINGGGSMGVEWFFYEELIRTLIRKFPYNKIIIMPQTIYYGNSELGKQEFENSKRIYAAHPDLHIVAREKFSFDIMKKAYPKNDILLTPDMVLSFNKCQPHLDRSGILLCLRSDIEKRLLPSESDEIYDFCRRYTDSVRYTDTSLGDVCITISMRGQELNKKFDEFKHAQLVITDRLHGMVFCAITGTPCITLSNYNYKVKGVYEWIKGLDYILYLDDYHEIPMNIPRLMNLSDREYDNRDFVPYFNKIAGLLN